MGECTSEAYEREMLRYAESVAEHWGSVCPVVDRWRPLTGKSSVFPHHVFSVLHFHLLLLNIRKS